MSIKSKGFFLLWVKSKFQGIPKASSESSPLQVLTAFSLSVLRYWYIFILLFIDSLARTGGPNCWNNGNFWTDELQRFGLPDDNLWLGALQLCAWGKVLHWEHAFMFHGSSGCCLQMWIHAAMWKSHETFFVVFFFLQNIEYINKACYEAFESKEKSLQFAISSVFLSMLSQ